MLTSPSGVLRFDKFVLDLARCAVLRGDAELPLRRQSFDVLRHLAEHRGEVVSRDELVTAVWAVRPARPEDSVFQCIKDIRRALGHDARWIVRAVPGRGYQFMADVIAIEAASLASSASPEPISPGHAHAGAPVPAGQAGPATLQWQRLLIVASLLITVIAGAGWVIWERLHTEPPSVLTMMPVPTLAVLPFMAPNDDPALGNEVRALSDDVTSEVARHILGSMISLRSTVGYRGETADIKATGDQLGARYLLFASVRREGDERSGSARLIESETGRELWASSFRYTPADYRLQAVRMASAVSLLVITTESQRPLPATPEAAHYGIIGFAALNNHRDPGSEREILGLFEKALELDHNWVPALLGYGWAQYALSGSEPSDRAAARLDKAHAAIERAIVLAPLNAATYHFLALVLRARNDPVGAIAANQNALKHNPNLPTAHGHLGLSKIDAGLAHEAIGHIEEALRLGPAHRWHSLWCLWAGQAAVHTANYDVAVEWLQKAMHAKVPRQKLKPWLAVAYAGLGREEEGRTLIAQHLKEGHRLSISGWRKRHPRRSGALAEQRARIEGLLRQLGVPEGKVHAGAHR